MAKGRNMKTLNDNSLVLKLHRRKEDCFKVGQNDHEHLRGG